MTLLRVVEPPSADTVCSRLFSLNEPLLCNFMLIENFKSFDFNPAASDIVDIKPANMEELTEVITAAEFHPNQCNTFVYSSSKGTIRLCDMRTSALCDNHAKCKDASFMWNNRFNACPAWMSDK